MKDTPILNKKVILLVVGTIAAITALLIAMAMIDINDKKKETVQIANLDTCSKQIDETIKKTIFETVFVYVKAANDFNNTSTNQSYSATIRPNSCKQLQQSDKSEQFNQTAIIVDIPTAKQSWKASYYWRTSDDKRPADLGEVAVTCLPKDQLVYDDFNCANVPLVKKVSVNAILDILPIIVAEYTNGYADYTEFKISSPTSKDGVPVLKITDTTGGNKDRAIDIIKQRGFNPDDYTIEYEYVPIIPIDDANRLDH